MELKVTNGLLSSGFFFFLAGFSNGNGRDAEQFFFYRFRSVNRCNFTRNRQTSEVVKAFAPSVIIRF